MEADENEGKKDGEIADVMEGITDQIWTEDNGLAEMEEQRSFQPEVGQDAVGKKKKINRGMKALRGISTKKRNVKPLSHQGKCDF